MDYVNPLAATGSGYVRRRLLSQAFIEIAGLTGGTMSR